MHEVDAEMQFNAIRRERQLDALDCAWIARDGGEHSFASQNDNKLHGGSVSYVHIGHFLPKNSAGEIRGRRLFSFGRHILVELSRQNLALESLAHVVSKLPQQRLCPTTTFCLTSRR